MPETISVKTLILLLSACGLVGGIVNAFLSAEGFILPKMQTLTDGTGVWRPGFLGNILVGIVAAVSLGCLSGPIGASKVISNIDAPSLANLAAAMLTGIGGARILTQEVDRKALNATKQQLGEAVQNLVKIGQIGS
jgi:hypothetical protein